jgi:hypothetical protein
LRSYLESSLEKNIGASAGRKSFKVKYPWYGDLCEFTENEWCHVWRPSRVSKGKISIF